jgi:hypothetical protein
VTLERWYRWLLAAYPRDHRDIYEDEMVGVLLEAAAPGQTRPTPAETTDLLLGAGRYRLRRTGNVLADPRWRLAASVTGVLAVIALFGVHLHRLVAEVSYVYTPYVFWDQRPSIGFGLWVPAALWAGAVVSAAFLPRPVTAALAWVGALIDLGMQGIAFERYAGQSVFDSWLPVLGLVAAGTLTFGSATRPALRVLGRRRLLLLAAVIVGFLGMDFRIVWDIPFLAWLVSNFRVVFPALGALVLIGLDRPVRRRVLALFVPVVVQVVTTWVGSYYYPLGFFNASMWAVPLKWAALVGLPVVALLIAISAVQRRERIIKLVALGRTVAAAQVVGRMADS